MVGSCSKMPDHCGTLPTLIRLESLSQYLSLLADQPFVSLDLLYTLLFAFVFIAVWMSNLDLSLSLANNTARSCEKGNWPGKCSSSNSWQHILIGFGVVVVARELLVTKGLVTIIYDKSFCQLGGFPGLIGTVRFSRPKDTCS